MRLPQTLILRQRRVQTIVDSASETCRSVEARSLTCRAKKKRSALSAAPFVMSAKRYALCTPGESFLRSQNERLKRGDVLVEPHARPQVRRLFGERREDIQSAIEAACGYGSPLIIPCCGLDAVIPAGYSVNSHRAVQFHHWATATLRGHLVQGYSYRSPYESRTAICWSTSTSMSSLRAR